MASPLKSVGKSVATSRAEPPPLAALTWEELSHDELHTIVAGAIDAVSPRTPGSVWVTSSSTEAESWTSDGWSSMNSRSTDSFGLIHFSGSAREPSGMASCSKLCSSMKCASVPSA